MSKARSLSRLIRENNYCNQTGSETLTPRQRRRVRHKDNHEMAVARRDAK